MTENRASENVEMTGFIEMVGQSFTDAQNSMLSGLNLSSNMVLNNADLEVKVTVDTLRGKMVVRPISSEEIRTGSIDPGLLSTLRISYVSTFDEPARAPVNETAPSHKTPSELVEEVLNRKDIQKLAGNVRDIRVNPTFVPEKSKWLISVEDKSGKVLQEIVLPD